jgi:hypothetical protein
MMAAAKVSNATVARAARLRRRNAKEGNLFCFLVFIFDFAVEVIGN